MVAGNGEPQRQFGSMTDTYSRGDLRRCAVEAVVAKLKRRFFAEQIEAVVGGTSDIERLAEQPGATCEFTGWRGGRQFAIECHGFEAKQGFKGADEDASGHAFRLAGDIHTKVHAIDEIDIGVPGLAEHYAVSVCDAAKAVRCRVGGRGDVRSQIGLNLDYASGKPACFGPMGEELTEQ